MDVQITSNTHEVLKAISDFKEDLAIRTVRGSMRRIAQYANDRLKEATPVFTGNLRFNEAVTAKYAQSRGIVTAKVVVNTRGKAGDIKNAFYWRWVEFGHKTRPSKEGGGQRDIPGQGFIQSTWARLQSQISSMFFSDLDRCVQRAGNRTGVIGG